MKNIGIFLDHATARMIDPTTGSITKEIHSQSGGHVRIPGESSEGHKVDPTHSTNNEHTQHNQENHDLLSYYKELAAEVKAYDGVYLFGPTTARDEFSNYLLKHHKQEGPKITSESSDYLTDNQLSAKVKTFFK